MTTEEMNAQIVELKSLLPVLLEKEKAGLIRPSYHKAQDLINWAERRGSLSEKQMLFVGRLIRRAKIKHRNVSLAVNTVSADIDAVTKKVLDIVGENKTDVETICKILEPRILASLEARAPRKVDVTVTHAKGKKVTVEGPKHEKFDALLRAANARLPNGYVPGIFLQGEASSGKTTGAKMLAEVLKLKWYFNGAISFPHEMLGFIDGAGKYHRTPFRDAYEHGGVYTFDEVDRSDPVALLAVNPHLANGVATFPDKQIVRHPDCIIVCTANTWGLGADANYSGATKLDAAFLSRFPIRINWDIDAQLEQQIVAHPEWLERIRNARVRARAVGLKVMIDTRAAQAGVALIAQGYSLDEAADMTYLANLKPEQRSQLKAHGGI
jgi:hypothetical protein